jgi:hypothetical protein
MRAILSAAIVGLAFAATPTTTQPQDAGDIRMNPLLSRPLTVMEHVLIKLQQEAEESAEEMARTSYSDKYKPMRSQSWSARIGLDDDTGRIVSEKTIYITSIDDPWR